MKEGVKEKYKKYACKKKKKKKRRKIGEIKLKERTKRNGEE